MSVEAISWAFQQPVPHASAKFVLVAMANHADADMRCWPSSVHLCNQTSQDRKTVQANLQRLREWGYIVDTGERRGATKQVPVYLLKQPENGPVKAPKQGQKVADNTTENGPVEQAQKWNSTENGTGPNFPHNRPVFPHEQAQISPQTGPKTGHGTIRNHQEPSGNQKQAASKSRPSLNAVDLIALGVESQVAEDWLALRAKKRLPLTKTALDQITAEVEKAGMTLPAALKLCCGRGWAGFNAEWLTPRAPGRDGSATSDKFRVAHLDHSSSRAAMEASMKKHNITIPDGDIDF